MEEQRLWQVAIVVAAIYGFCSASSELEKKVEALQEMNQRQETMIQEQQLVINDLVKDNDRRKRSTVNSPSGSVYTRWGRTSCPTTSTLIYEGFAAGTNYNTPGGGSNYQCMPLNPEYNGYTAGGIYSVLSGAEYQSWTLGIFPDFAHNKNVPCARCYTPGTAMMIPAKRSCPSGWTKEYEGYLMTAETIEDRKPTTYECVDASPEYINGHSDNSDGALFYFVKPDCDGQGRIAHCPPYIPDRQLTCVVCS